MHELPTQQAPVAAIGAVVFLSPHPEKTGIATKHRRTARLALGILRDIIVDFSLPSSERDIAPNGTLHRLARDATRNRLTARACYAQAMLPYETSVVNGISMNLRPPGPAKPIELTQQTPPIAAPTLRHLPGHFFAGHGPCEARDSPTGTNRASRPAATVNLVTSTVAREATVPLKVRTVPALITRTS